MPQPESHPDVAYHVAHFLHRRGIRRVFGLQGGHIQPIWHQAALQGITVVDVRDERAAVHMAQAHAELTGELGVAMVTAGPAVTNTVTGIANAHVSRTPLLLLGGCPPRPQVNMGPLQDVPHVEVLRPLTRQARTVRVPEQAIRELDEAVARALGDGGEPGPVYVEFPTDVLRARVADSLVLPEHLTGRSRGAARPDPADVGAAADLIAGARRPVVVTGRGARRAVSALETFLQATGALYLDTQETKGLLPDDNEAHAGAVRGRVMAEADLVLTVGRKLDYQLGFGSPVVWPQARFVRISDMASELIDNRRGEVELLADPRATLEALSEALSERRSRRDTQWLGELRSTHADRVSRMQARLGQAAPGEDGAMHPDRIFAAIHELGLRNPVLVADGGDILSFARVGLPAGQYLDPGAFGCLGVGVPYGIAAALQFPDRPVLCVIGDGAFGFNAIEVDTAVRHGAKAVFVVANNAAWNIERYDQEVNYGLVAGTELGAADYGAMARALGAHGERVDDPDELVPALRRAFAAAPAVLDVVVTRDAVSSDTTKGLSTVPDYQALLPWHEAEVRRRQPWDDTPADPLARA